MKKNGPVWSFNTTETVGWELSEISRIQSKLAMEVKQHNECNTTIYSEYSNIKSIINQCNIGCQWANSLIESEIQNCVLEFRNWR